MSVNVKTLLAVLKAHFGVRRLSLSSEGRPLESSLHEFAMCEIVELIADTVDAPPEVRAEPSQRDRIKKVRWDDEPTGEVPADTVERLRDACRTRTRQAAKHAIGRAKTMVDGPHLIEMEAL